VGLVLAVIVGCAILQCRDADPDLFARLAVGRLLDGLGYLPHQDPFAFTDRYPTWFDHEWGSGVLFYWVYGWFGDAGLRALAAIFAAITMGLVYRLLRVAESSAPTIAAGLIGLLIFCEIGFVWGSIVRSQVVTYLLYTYLLVSIQRWEKGSRRWLLFMPALFLLWGACHGGVLAGELVLLLWSGERLVRRLLTPRSSTGTTCEREPLLLGMIALLSIGVLFVNPYGPSFVLFLLYATRMHRPNIGEWAPRSLFAPNAIPLLLGLILAAFSMPRLLRTRRWAPASILAITAYKAVSHTRLSPLFIIPVYVWSMPEILACWGRLRLSAERMVVLNRAATGGLLVVALISAATVLLGRGAPIGSLSYAGYPVDAINWIKAQGKSERLLVDFNSGSYALWRLYPETLVSLDGRYEELYPEKTVSDVSRALSTLDDDLLSRLRPTLIILPNTTLDGHTGTGLSNRLQVKFRGELYSVLAFDSANSP
jgi:hypothetical protein